MDYIVQNQKAHQVFQETPARFSWHPVSKDARYTLLVYDNLGNLYQTYSELDCSFFTPNHKMPTGWYQYTVLEGDEILVENQSFEIAESAKPTPLTSRKDRYKKEMSHPRLWLNQTGIETLREKRHDALADVWQAFMVQGVEDFINQPIIEEPTCYPGHERVIDLWRSMYITCQEVLYTIKHCAVAWQVTQESRYLATAKTCLMAITQWALEGATARAYNDEAGFRVLLALAWGYDWLYVALSESERLQVKAVLLARGQELFHYVKDEIQIHVKVMDSHGVRSMSMALLPAALALYEEADEATDWLNYITEYFYALYTPWGGVDGGWAEGPNYWQSGLAFVTEALCLLNQAFSLPLYKRPFYQNTGDFPLNTYCQDMRFMGFGDMSDLGNYPGPKVGYIMRLLSVLSESPNRHQYAWYFDQAQKQGQDQAKHFANYGWWNFAFDDLFFRTQFDPIKSQAPEPGVQVKWFKDVDWVCMHKDMADPKNHIGFQFKASAYGAVSHSHGDQNAFVLHAYGEPLAIQSGYYVGFWSDMHVQYRRHTLSKNAILIDGQGQYAQIYRTSNVEDKNPSAKSQFEALVKANGHIEACEQHATWSYCRGNATKAYQPNSPYLNSYVRQVLFDHRGLFVIIDQVDLAKPGQVQWLLHSLSEMTLLNNKVKVQQGQVHMDVYFVNTDMQMTQSNGFKDVDVKEIEKDPVQWHLEAQTQSTARYHEIITVLHPYKTEDARTIQIECVADDRFNMYYEDAVIKVRKQTPHLWQIESQ